MGGWFEFVAGASLGALAAAVLLWVWAGNRQRWADAELDRLRSQLTEEVRLRAAAEVQASRVGELEQRLSERDEQLANLRAELSSLQARLDGERRAAGEKLELVNRAREALTEAFRALSADALSRNSQEFLRLARENLEKFQRAGEADLAARQKAVEDLVRPLVQQVERMQTYLGEVEKQRVAAYAALSEQLRELVQSHLPQLQSEAAKLAKALRQPAARGRWGELQLRRVVEMAGMQQHCDFLEQVSGDGEDGRVRPDLIVRLPGGRQVVVDAKVPLDAYLAATEAEAEEERARLLKQHANQVRAHMASLGKRAYFEQFEAAPDFVVMFVPGEAFFSAALEADPGLIEFGQQHRVIPASPTTLIALLKAVAYGWRQEAVAENAQRVAELGRELYRRIGDLGKHWAAVGERLARTVEAYNASVGALERRVLVSARRFEALGAAPGGAELPGVGPVEVLPRRVSAPELSGERAVGDSAREG